jgi:exodeoxyribonuclease VIII
MPAEQYHNGPEHSNSGLTVLHDKTPAHYDLYRNGLLKKTTPSLDLGTDVHAVLLEPERFDLEYAVGPDARRNSKEWKEFEAENEGKRLLKQAEYDLLLSVKKRIFSSCRVAQWIMQQPGDTEVSVFWTDEATGLPCRCRPDKLIRYNSKNLIIDIKTCRDASPEGFEKSIRSYGYARNDAFYRRGLIAATGEPAEYLILAIEKPSMIAAVYEIEREDQIEAGIEINTLLATIKECEESGSWPGYSDEIKTIRKRRFR